MRIERQIQNLQCLITGTPLKQQVQQMSHTV